MRRLFSSRTKLSGKKWQPETRRSKFERGEEPGAEEGKQDGKAEDN